MAEWRERVGGRAAVWLAGAAALVSVLVGIANISGGAPQGPLVEVVPAAVSRTAGFTGTLTGFLLLLSAYGLNRSYRSAWYSTVVLLPLSAAQGLLQTSELSYPLVGLSVVAWPVVAFNRRLFTREVELTVTQWAALAALVGSLGYSTAGAYALRDQFGSVETLTDAVYFSVVTASTVGYGDVTPTSQLAKWFTMSALVLNVASFAVALGVLFTPAIEARLTNALGRMTENNLDILERHVLVLGHGELTESLIEELADAGVDFLLVTPDEAVARALRDRGVDVLTADPSGEEPLTRAKITEARAVVAATNDDAQDALAILTARQLNPEVTIVAAATDRENENKLKRAGADTVISPARIGGHLLVESALDRGDSEAVAREILDDEDGAGGDERG
ncbi:NAD-binding protein [Candidatus Halobonum tyrrellensis]|uniref:Potassium channel-like protein n=1 Tax=Candidatus Halobonum tyrrellensis G22 TaxID=1324957 RepID=V4HAV5_9EURY|nr:NAD-binding protein [Candidatus Halobonum tyrrellensis]ESP87810.1 potassium channel-like protein [Candidatus Halobonum tyrrellensis G22]